jgi:hypothetical protein
MDTPSWRGTELSSWTTLPSPSRTYITKHGMNFCGTALQIFVYFINNNPGQLSQYSD